MKADSEVASMVAMLVASKAVYSAEKKEIKSAGHSADKMVAHMAAS